MRAGYRVIDVDSHVTPSLEVLRRHADGGLKARWDELAPFVRTMNSPPGRGHPEEPWTTLKINPIPYDRVAGQQGRCRGGAEGRRGRAGGTGARTSRARPAARGYSTTTAPAGWPTWTGRGSTSTA